MALDIEGDNFIIPESLLEDCQINVDTLEEFVHEFVHYFLCKQKLKEKMYFNIGNGRQVDSLISRAYPNVYHSDLHEIKTSAITFLILQKMKDLTFDKDFILNAMLGNLLYSEKLDESRAAFLFEKSLESKSCQKLSKNIFETILKLKERF